MPCRVGITTNPSGRKAYWETKVVGFTKWRILKVFRTQQDAQDYETSYAVRYDCEFSPGGQPASGPWSVYRFDYTRRRA